MSLFRGSLRAHLFDAVLRLAVRRRLGQVFDVQKIRASLDRRGRPDPRGVAFTPGALGGVPGEWAVAQAGEGEETAGETAPALLYCHGGGFIACSPKTHRPITGAFARAGFRVFVPDYRLAPEHPFPAGLEDVVAAWAALSARGLAAIAGDSAGGNLALATLLEARRRGLPPPAAAALFCPVTDLLGRSPSLRRNAAWDAMFKPEALMRLAPVYLAGADPGDPRISPIEGDLAGLPPLLIHAGEREMLRDDSMRFADKARAAGTAVTLRLWPVVPHAWQIAGDALPEARLSLTEAADFLHRHLAHKAALDEAMPA